MFVLNNAISDIKWNQITDTIEETGPPILLQLDYCTCINYNLIPFSEDKNITATLQKGVTGYKWFTVYDITWMNYSITFLNVD